MSLGRQPNFPSRPSEFLLHKMELRYVNLGQRNLRHLQMFPSALLLSKSERIVLDYKHIRPLFLSSL
jgi:hypothetical protein